MNERWKVISLPDKQGKQICRYTGVPSYYRQIRRWRIEMYADVGRRCCPDGLFCSSYII